MDSPLLRPFQLGELSLKNRMVMAPMTRNRATPTGVPTSTMATFYAQRSSAGLIISESAPVSSWGVGYPNTPGLYTEEQVAGWMRLINGIHAGGSHIFAQLQHCGRVSHPSHHADAATPVAPSAITAAGNAVTPSGYQRFVTPRALEVSEIKEVIGEFKIAAENAKQAGFDGLELHGANGYLIDQFLRDGTNQRTDPYGGSIRNRIRFLNEVLDSVSEVFPFSRIGVRLTPENSFNDMNDSDAQSHFEYIVAELSARKLSYLHVLEGHMDGTQASIDYARLRELFGGTYIANNGYDKSRGERSIESGAADLIAYGIPFLANPDLVDRFQRDLPLNRADPTTFYGGSAEGYIDYPSVHAGLIAAE